MAMLRLRVIEGEGRGLRRLRVKVKVEGELEIKIGICSDIFDLCCGCMYVCATIVRLRVVGWCCVHVR